MSTKEEVERHPLAIAWDEWLASPEGQECRQANTLAHNTNTYLENRLHRAFDAAWNARSFPSEAERELLMTIQGFLETRSMHNLAEPLAELIERINS